MRYNTNQLIITQISVPASQLNFAHAMSQCDWIYTIFDQIKLFLWNLRRWYLNCLWNIAMEEQWVGAYYRDHIMSHELIKLDESTARQQPKSPWSLSGRSIHLTLVTKWSWSWMTYCHPLCAMSIGPRILRYSYFKIWPRRSMQVQTHWSYLRPGVQSICLLFVSWQSDHFWLRYSKFHIWPWKI